TGPLEFTLRDRIDHPLYWWPRTLLNYRVRFDAAQPCATAAGLNLSAGPDNPVAFQLSEVEAEGGCLRSAVVSFLADLPSGGEPKFLLSRACKTSAGVAMEGRRQENWIELD